MGEREPAGSTRGGSRIGGDGAQGGLRPVVYCVVPADLAPKLHDPLRAHFAADPGVEVIVERRSAERRRSADRRVDADQGAGGEERRRLRGARGRRVAERRALAVMSAPPALPRRARRHADRLKFLQRLEPASEELADRDSARAVLAFQAGDADQFGLLYERYFERVYGYVRRATGDRALAEDLTQTVFATALEDLDRFELRRPSGVRQWLFAIARNMTLDAMAERYRLSAAEPEALAGLCDSGAARAVAGRVPEAESEDPEIGGTLGWISDRDVALLVELLPEAQRQVIVMRFHLDLSPREIAELLGRSEDAVRQLQARALRTVRQRLAPSRAAAGGRRAPTRERIGALPVLGARRFALAYGGRPLAALAQRVRSWAGAGPAAR